MTTLAAYSMQEIRRMLEQGRCSSVEVVQSVLEALDVRNPGLNAYLEVDADDALAQARAADEARARGQQGALLGVPLAIKDNLNVCGQRCGCASRMLADYQAPYDATVIARLRAAGALFVGRTNMDEFAMGSSCENSALGPARNPWRETHVPGGSSGGSASAVAAGIALGALGSDTGGSIRQPAAFCGCVGIKPTYGRVSRYGLTAFGSSFDQVGPMTREVGDAALLLQVMAGHDPMDSTTLQADVPDYTGVLGGDLKGLRLGLPSEYFDQGIDPEVAEGVHTAAALCRDLGAELVDVHLPHTRYAIACYYILTTAEASANLARFDGVRYGLRVDGDDPLELNARTRAAGFGPEVKRRVLMGTYALSSGYYDAYYLRAQKVRTLIRRDFTAAFEGCDALLAPVAPTAAYRLGERIEDPLQMYLGDILTVPANLAGLCACSVPCGFNRDGLPLSLQVLAPPLGEEVMLRVAQAYQAATDWPRMPAMPDGGAENKETP